MTDYIEKLIHVGYFLMILFIKCKKSKNITLNNTMESENTDNIIIADGVNWHLQLSYDGTEYSGWQVQNEHKTVQGEILKRLRLMFQAPDLRLQGCSRTDAGVHALDQHACFKLIGHDEIDAEWLKYKLNRWLPEDILIKNVTTEDDDFNPRFSNYGKAYTYCISSAKKVNPLASKFVWKTPRELDVEAMRKAAALLQGEHDFASFAANPGREIGSTVRKLYRLEVIEAHGLIFINAVGESFLYKMVRGLTGYLAHVGFGYATPEDALKVLEAKNRSAAADSAPAKGLFLAKVFWKPDEWMDYEPVLPPFAL